ncbi:MAG: hypothetical protein H0X16_02500 [Chloroflexi bacterium]|nr:hypothetical protein [Chloroflexota bacterium]
MTSRDTRGQQGQALVVFVLALVAIIAMTGLVLDGGAAFAQRRAQQNVADLAAVAAAVTYGNTVGAHGAKDAAARARALEVAAQNGFPDGVNDTEIIVDGNANPGNGSMTYEVTVERPHRNNFAGLVGQPTWPVAADAQAIAGLPNAAIGAMPIIFNIEAFDAQNQAGQGPPPPVPYSLPGTGNEDVPKDATSFNWTVYCTALGNDCNANSETVRKLIEQNGEDAVVTLNADIGPLNAGDHVTLFERMGQRWTGAEFPVAIVDDEGRLQGWAMFHLTAVEGNNRKVIIGYFVSPVNAEGMEIVSGGGLGGAFGSYTMQLVN